MAWVLAAAVALFAQHARQDAAATREVSGAQRAGIAYASALLALQRAWQQERLAAVLPGTAQGAAAGVAVTDGQQAWVALEALQRSHGQALGTDAHMRALRRTTQDLPGPGAHRAATFEAHSARLQALIDLLAVTAEASNLTLDSDFGSYPLMDAAVFQLPALIEALAQWRILAVAAAKGEPPGSLQGRPLVEPAQLAARRLAALDERLRRAIRVHPELEAALGAREALLEVRRLVPSVEAAVRRQPGQGNAMYPAQVHGATADRAIEALWLLTGRVHGQLQRLLARRADRLEARRRLLDSAWLLGLGLLVGCLPTPRHVVNGRRSHPVPKLAATAAGA